VCRRWPTRKHRARARWRRSVKSTCSWPNIPPPALDEPSRDRGGVDRDDGFVVPRARRVDSRRCRNFLCRCRFAGEDRGKASRDEATRWYGFAKRRRAALPDEDRRFLRRGHRVLSRLGLFEREIFGRDLERCVRAPGSSAGLVRKSRRPPSSLRPRRRVAVGRHHHDGARFVLALAALEQAPCGVP